MKVKPIGLGHELNGRMCEKEESRIRLSSGTWATGRIMGLSVVTGKARGRASLKGNRSAI